MDKNKLIATTVVVAYSTLHLYGGVDIPAKPLTLAIQNMAATTANNAVYVPNMMTSKDLCFDVTPPVDRRPGRPTEPRLK